MAGGDSEFRSEATSHGAVSFDLMEKYLPGWLSAWAASRQVFFPTRTNEEAVGLAIPRKYRELIMIAIQLTTQHGGGQGYGSIPGETHTRRAVSEEGVTPKEVAEVVAIGAYLCGQAVIADYGARCIEIAEEEHAKATRGAV